MDENELRQTIDAMGRTIERDAKRIAALKAELAEAKEYAQALRSMLADVLGAHESLIKSEYETTANPEPHKTPLTIAARNILAGQVRP